MKKTSLVFISSIILFSLINIGSAQAGHVLARVLYNDGCPRAFALVGIYDNSHDFVGLCGISDETGYCENSFTGLLPNKLYKANATWLGPFFEDQNFATNDYGNGVVTIQGPISPTYPQGTETCNMPGDPQDSECDGLQYCVGDPKYIECDSWNTDCDSKKCCSCNGGTLAIPTQNYDSSQNVDCPFCQKCTAIDTCGNQADGEDLKDQCNPFDLSKIETCDNDPDLIHFTWDFRNPFTSACNGAGSCTNGDSTITHTCNQPTCGANCDEDSDCGSGRTCKADCTCTADTTPPQWSNEIHPPNPSVYNPSATYTFNITWTDNEAVDEVILEMDGTNYSSKSSYIVKTVWKTGYYNYSMTFSTCTGGGGGGGHYYMMSMNPITPLIEIWKFLTGGTVMAQETPCIGVGTHNYKWYANDTRNNWGSTNLLTFTIYNKDPITIDIISPQNRTYPNNSVSLNFVVSSPFPISWVGYSLDDKPNVTVESSTVLTDLPEGSHNVIMYGNTTYEVMNSSQRVYFTIRYSRPDLIVNDMWNWGNTIYYNIKNQGDNNSIYSYSKLYVDSYYKANDYVSSLPSGSYSTETFSYSWICSGSSDTVKVCADDYNYVIESNENNNCLTKTFTCPVTTTIPCKCTAWQATFTCCYGGKEKWVRTCAPKGCQAESKCEGPCFV